MIFSRKQSPSSTNQPADSSSQQESLQHRSFRSPESAEVALSLDSLFWRCFFVQYLTILSSSKMGYRSWRIQVLAKYWSSYTNAIGFLETKAKSRKLDPFYCNTGDCCSVTSSASSSAPCHPEQLGNGFPLPLEDFFGSDSLLVLQPRSIQCKYSCTRPHHPSIRLSFLLVCLACRLEGFSSTHR